MVSVLGNFLGSLYLTNLSRKKSALIPICWILTNENAKENKYRLLAGIYYFIDYAGFMENIEK
jgi:hypothetical protein